jgi:UDP-N-acetylglucosamine 2-epimerase (non-hydrolysing)
MENLAIPAQRTTLIEELGLTHGAYFLMTVHREENVDSEEALREILEGIRLVRQAYEEPVVFAAHPRTLNRLEQFDLMPFVETIDGLRLIEAQGYLSFLSLAANASLILTDSGGVQQEACILRVPCVTLRDTTEWTESVERGANLLAGTSPDAILQAVQTMRDVERVWDNPFGDGKAAAKIADVVEEALDPARRWDGPEILDVSGGDGMAVPSQEQPA